MSSDAAESVRESKGRLAKLARRYSIGIVGSPSHLLPEVSRILAPLGEEAGPHHETGQWQRHVLWIVCVDAVDRLEPVLTRLVELRARPRCIVVGRLSGALVRALRRWPWVTLVSAREMRVELAPIVIREIEALPLECVMVVMRDLGVGNLPLAWVDVAAKAEPSPSTVGAWATLCRVPTRTFRHRWRAEGGNLSAKMALDTVRMAKWVMGHRGTMLLSRRRSAIMSRLALRCPALLPCLKSDVRRAASSANTTSG